LTHRFQFFHCDITRGHRMDETEIRLTAAETGDALAGRASLIAILGRRGTRPAAWGTNHQ